MVEKAGLYGDSLTLTCILYEANITVSSTAIVENGKLGKNTYALGTQIEEGDFVGLHADTDNTYANTGGLPVVEYANTTGGWIGIVKSQPVFHKIPTTTQSTWDSTRLTSGYYRVASVVFPTLNMAFKAQSKGDGTPIENGAPLSWDISEGAFIDFGVPDGATIGGLFSFHYNASDDTNILVGCGFVPGSTGNTDAAGFTVA
jgi:hypothetical protein